MDAENVDAGGAHMMDEEKGVHIGMDVEIPVVPVPPKIVSQNNIIPKKTAPPKAPKISPVVDVELYGDRTR